MNLEVTLSFSEFFEALKPVFSLCVSTFVDLAILLFLVTFERFDEVIELAAKVFFSCLL